MSRRVAAPCWDRGVPARTEFCADPDGLQTTWLRSCACGTRGTQIIAQNLDHVVFLMRDGIAPRRIIGRHPFAGIATPRPRPTPPRVLRLNCGRLPQLPTPRLGARLW